MFAMKRLAAVLGLIALAACSDKLGPGSVDPAAMDASLEDVASSFTGNAAFQSLSSLAPLFPQFAAVAAMREGMPPATRLGPGLTAALRQQGAALSAIMSPRAPGDVAALFPANVLGKTLVWNTDSLKYLIGTGISGAPANGVRIRLYTVNQNTGQPVVPLQLLGYVDLTDESTPQADKLGILLKLGSTTVADYAITVTSGTTSARVVIGGYLTAGDGSGRIDFDLDSYSSDTATDLVYVVTGGGADIRFEEHGDANGDGTILVRLQKGGNTVELVGNSVADDFTGQVKYNGTVVANITTVNGDPVFTGANGHTLTDQEKAHLASIFGNVTLIVFVFFFGLLTPAFVVFTIV